MDRHQFVESLLEKRNAAQKELEQLCADRQRAYARSRQGIAELLAPKPNTGNCLSIGTLCYVERVSLPEEERVSDDAIITLCGEICSLRKSCADERSAIARYKQEDVVVVLKKALETVA